MNAYEDMLRKQKSQCFVISGESGAGKSETTKFLVSHLIELCKSGKATLEEQILRVNPMLEAFGNAKTVMNDNSSRFGKFLELAFDMTGAVVGGKSHDSLSGNNLPVLHRSELCLVLICVHLTHSRALRLPFGEVARYGTEWR